MGYAFFSYGWDKKHDASMVAFCGAGVDLGLFVFVDQVGREADRSDYIGVVSVDAGSGGILCVFALDGAGDLAGERPFGVDLCGCDEYSVAVCVGVVGAKIH